MNRSLSLSSRTVGALALLIIALMFWAATWVGTVSADWSSSLPENIAVSADITVQDADMAEGDAVEPRRRGIGWIIVTNWEIALIILALIVVVAIIGAIVNKGDEGAPTEGDDEVTPPPAHTNTARSNSTATRPRQCPYHPDAPSTMMAGRKYCSVSWCGESWS